MKERKTAAGYRLVFGYLGLFMMLIGVLTWLPCAFFYYQGEWVCWPYFVYPGLGNFLVGLLLYLALLRGRKPGRFERHEDSLLLFLTWIFAIVAGALPMWLATFFGKEAMDMSFIEALFESTSAYSTTGLTAFKSFLDVEGAYCPHVYTFHRSLMQFIGGVGLVLLLTSLIGGGASMTLFQGEGHNDRIFASMSKTSKAIFGIYFGYTAAGTLALFLSGMPLFEAACTAMCALSGGGLSPRSANIYAYRGYEGQLLVNAGGVNSPLPVNSLAIEIVMMFLVAFSAISFLLHTFLLRFKWGKFFKDDEIRFLLISLILTTAVAFLGAVYSVSLATKEPLFADWPSTFRDVIWYTMASWTNSGFSATTPTRLIQLGRPLFFLCILLMLIGGGVGSTAGGVKQYRVVIVLRDVAYSIRHRFAPARLIAPEMSYRYGKRTPLEQSAIKEAKNYMFVFLTLFFASIVALVFCPCGDTLLTEVSLSTIAFNVASALSNTGLGVTDFIAYRDYVSAQGVGGFYAFYLAILTLDMFLGRLEIMPLLYSAQNIREEIAHTAEKRRAARTAPFEE